ncbi:MAG: TlpA disulfide reductase family protein [Proteobacteria bacterium]|nr:TlpA disulfide reductase family protein [Pseudomonadota bacterium]
MAAQGQALKNGDLFPDLKKFNLEGNLPGELSGKIVLVDFWASWCGPCKASFPVFADLHERYKSRGLIVIAISVDEDAQAMKRFLEKHSPPFSVVRDADHELVKEAKIKTMPTSFLIDQTGRIQLVHHGFKSKSTPQEYVKAIEASLKETASEVPAP